jgi:hypothetical protein
LPEELSSWLSGGSNNIYAWGKLPHHAGLCPNARAVADPEMSIDGGLPSHLDEILQGGRTGNTGLGYDDATPAEDNIMSDLYQVIEA